MVVNIRANRGPAAGIGAYTQGADAETDAAIERFPHLRAFIQQGINQRVLMPESIANLQAVIRSQAPKNAGPLASQHHQNQHQPHQQQR